MFTRSYGFQSRFSQLPLGLSLYRGLPSWERSYKATVSRRLKFKKWGIEGKAFILQSYKSLSKHYFVFLYPKTSFPPIYKYDLGAKTIFSGSRHCFITLETKRLSFSFPLDNPLTNE